MDLIPPDCPSGSNDEARKALASTLFQLSSIKNTPKELSDLGSRPFRPLKLDGFGLRALNQTLPCGPLPRRDAGESIVGVAAPQLHRDVDEFQQLCLSSSWRSLRSSSS